MASLHVQSLHARTLCVNLIDESGVLAKKAVDHFECVEISVKTTPQMTRFRDVQQAIIMATV